MEEIEMEKTEAVGERGDGDGRDSTGGMLLDQANGMPRDRDITVQSFSPFALRPYSSSFSENLTRLAFSPPSVSVMPHCGSCL